MSGAVQGKGGHCAGLHEGAALRNTSSRTLRSGQRLRGSLRLTLSQCNGLLCFSGGDGIGGDRSRWCTVDNHFVIGQFLVELQLQAGGGLLQFLIATLLGGGQLLRTAAVADIRYGAHGRQHSRDINQESDEQP